MKSILGIGTSVVDILARAPRAAVGNEMVSFVDYSKQGGGMVATAIIAAARLGAPCQMITPVGMTRWESFAGRTICATVLTSLTC